MFSIGNFQLIFFVCLQGYNSSETTYWKLTILQGRNACDRRSAIAQHTLKFMTVTAPTWWTVNWFLWPQGPRAMCFLGSYLALELDVSWGLGGCHSGRFNGATGYVQKVQKDICCRDHLLDPPIDAASCAWCCWFHRFKWLGFHLPAGGIFQRESRPEWVFHRPALILRRLQFLEGLLVPLGGDYLEKSSQLVSSFPGVVGTFPKADIYGGPITAY